MLDTILNKIDNKIQQLKNSIEYNQDKLKSYDKLFYIEKFAIYSLEDEYTLELFKYFKEVIQAQVRHNQNDKEFLIRFILNELKYTDLPANCSNYSISITNQWKTKAYQEFLEYILN